jgi:hypothetical protein
MATLRDLIHDSEFRSPLLIDPSPTILAYVVDDVDLVGGSLEVLATEDVVTTTFEDFAIASNAGDRVDDGTLDIHLLPSETENTLLVGEETVHALLNIDGEPKVITTRDDDIVEAATTKYREQFNKAAAYTFKTPSRSTVQRTLRDVLGDKFETDFTAVIDRLDYVRDDTDVVTVALLVTARHNEQFYQVAKWAETAGVASKSTFSRRRTALEEEGILSTEKMKLEVGRPRLELQIADEAAVESIIG